MLFLHGSDDRGDDGEAAHGRLERAGAPVRYTEYRGVGHISWDRAYAEPEPWEWLFAQRRDP